METCTVPCNGTTKRRRVEEWNVLTLLFIDMKMYTEKEKKTVMHSNSTCVYEYAVVSWIHVYLYPIVFSTPTTSSSFSRKIGVWQRSLTVDSICDVYCRRCKCLCIYNYAYGWNVCNMCKCVCHSYRTNNNEKILSFSFCSMIIVKCEIPTTNRTRLPLKVNFTI